MLKSRVIVWTIIARSRRNFKCNSAECTHAERATFFLAHREVRRRRRKSPMMSADFSRYRGDDGADTNSFDRFSLRHYTGLKPTRWFVFTTGRTSTPRYLILSALLTFSSDTVNSTRHFIHECDFHKRACSRASFSRHGKKKKKDNPPARTSWPL